MNGAYNSETDDIGKLMHDFRCTDASDMNFSALADKVRYFKNEEGRKNMSRIIEEMCDEAAAEAAVEAAHNNSIEIAIKLIQQGKQSVEEIAYLTGLSIEVVNELVRKRSA